MVKWNCFRPNGASRPRKPRSWGIGFSNGPGADTLERRPPAVVGPVVRKRPLRPYRRHAALGTNFSRPTTPGRTAGAGLERGGRGGRAGVQESVRPVPRAPGPVPRCKGPVPGSQRPVPSRKRPVFGRQRPALRGQRPVFRCKSPVLRSKRPALSPIARPLCPLAPARHEPETAPARSGGGFAPIGDLSQGRSRACLA